LTIWRTQVKDATKSCLTLVSLTQSLSFRIGTGLTLISMNFSTRFLSSLTRTRKLSLLLTNLRKKLASVAASDGAPFILRSSGKRTSSLSTIKIT
jgi:hypothetical protein